MTSLHKVKPIFTSASFADNMEHDIKYRIRTQSATNPYRSVVYRPLISDFLPQSDHGTRTCNHFGKLSSDSKACYAKPGGPYDRLTWQDTYHIKVTPRAANVHY
ncbi:hypothetical protein PoB_001155600 [Plakobranchus ocellatus]|uniref:Uncharacterized protein n=1 Tax=Plakobranchus ocellatus TaxID=259542 RepID=A0AAV3YP27_9GAST|nr:hypothetical protein PoB_001155600 [Plakobranchus ocellatus]